MNKQQTRAPVSLAGGGVSVSPPGRERASGNHRFYGLGLVPPDRLFDLFNPAGPTAGPETWAMA